VLDTFLSIDLWRELYPNYKGEVMARKPDYRKKDFIAKVSTELFARKGYQNTSIEQIARESGYAVGTIYLYFDAKEEILTAILIDFVNSMTREYKTELENVTDPFVRFRKVVKLFLKAAEENPDRALVLATELRKVVRADSHTYKVEMGKLLSLIGDSLRALNDAGYTYSNFDPDYYKVMIYGAIENIALVWNVEKKESIVDNSDQIADMLLAGVGCKV
jgi:TetR/AcrR family fatty acid metabolism transcriptional regulator